MLLVEIVPNVEGVAGEMPLTYGTGGRSVGHRQKRLSRRLHIFRAPLTRHPIWQRVLFVNWPEWTKRTRCLILLAA